MRKICVVEDSRADYPTAVGEIRRAKSSGDSWWKAVDLVMKGETDCTETFKKYLEEVQAEGGVVGILVDLGLEGEFKEDFSDERAACSAVTEDFWTNHFDAMPRNYLRGALFAVQAILSTLNHDTRKLAVVIITGQRGATNAIQLIQNLAQDGKVLVEREIAGKEDAKFRSDGDYFSSFALPKLRCLMEQLEEPELHPDGFINDALLMFSKPWRDPLWSQVLQACQNDWFWSHSSIDSNRDAYIGLVKDWLMKGTSAGTLPTVSITEKDVKALCRLDQRNPGNERCEETGRLAAWYLGHENHDGREWVGTWYFPGDGGESKKLGKELFRALLIKAGIKDKNITIATDIECLRLPVTPALPFLTALRQLLLEFHRQNRNLPQVVIDVQRFNRVFGSISYCMEIDLPQAPYGLGSRFSEKVAEDRLNDGVCGALNDLIWCRTNGITSDGTWAMLFKGEGVGFLPVPCVGLQFTMQGVRLTWH